MPDGAMWEFAKSYSTGDTVSWGGGLWIAARDNVGRVPVTGADWTLVPVAVSPAPGGGASVPSQVTVIVGSSDTNVAAASLTVPIFPASALASGQPSTGMTSIQAKVAPGGLVVSGVSLIAPTAAAVSYVEVDVSNVDKTELIELGTAATIDLLADTPHSISQAEYGGAALAQVGTDLALQSNGSVTSTAGGVFWITGLVQILGT